MEILDLGESVLCFQLLPKKTASRTSMNDMDLMGEALRLLTDTQLRTITWEMRADLRGFVTTADGAQFEIAQEDEYVYKLSKYGSSHELICELKNDDPFPGELSAGHCDKDGYTKDRAALPLLSQRPYYLKRLYDGAKGSASLSHR